MVKLCQGGSKSMDIRKYAVIQSKILGHRKKRVELFFQTFKPSEQTSILDIGGTIDFWEFYATYPRRLNITILNLRYPTIEGKVYRNNYQFIQANALSLPFRNKSFDIVFSNSLIDHLYSFENQEKFASEVDRVSNNYFIQTGNKNFPYEPHYLTPFINYLSKNMQKKIVRNFTFWGLLARPTSEQVNSIVDEIILSTKSEFKSLFPDALIMEQKILAMVKSFIAIKNIDKFSTFHNYQ